MKKILALMLSLSLLLGVCVTASAAANTLKNFEKTETYANQFTDVAQSYWAATAIRTCYEYGLMQGYDGDSFVPKGNLTVAQAIVMADRVHEIYTTGESTLANGAPWYQPYVDYAMENGIIQAGDFTNYNAQVTRAQMAYIFCNALPGNALPAINFIQSVPDVSSSDPYQKDILTLYQAGVLTGSDIYGTFKPNDNIIRAEAAAIIARVAIPAQRQNVTLLKDYTWNNVTLAVPQDAEEDYSSGLLGLVSDSAYTVAMLYREYDEVFRGVDITILSPKEMGQLVSQSLTENGMKEKEMSTAKVSFGSLPAYRSVGVVTMQDQVLDVVIYTYVHDSSMDMLTFLGAGDMERSGVVLKNMVNNVCINGAAVSPQY